MNEQEVELAEAMGKAISRVNEYINIGKIKSIYPDFA